MTLRRADGWRPMGVCGASLGWMVLVGLLGTAQQALAQSGDFPLTPGNPAEVPTYTISEDSCDTIREAVDAQFDLVLACSIGGRQSGVGNSPCDLIDGSINAGIPIGQCLDSFPTPLIAPDPAGDVLEEDVDLNASAAGLNLALDDRDRISVTSVAGASGTLLGLVDVLEGECPDGGCPASCGGIAVRQSAAACSEVTAQLVRSVLPDPPALSHALFLDVQETATSAFLSVNVCPGYKWTCADPADPLSGTGYEGQVPFSIAYTPLCTRTSRLTLCCATNAAGQPIKPCPR